MIQFSNLWLCLLGKWIYHNTEASNFSFQDSSYKLWDYVEKVSKQKKIWQESLICDDLFVGNFDAFHEHLNIKLMYKIFPREWLINPDLNYPKNIAYLDLKITLENDGINFSIYDKRDYFRF